LLLRTSGRSLWYPFFCPDLSEATQIS
jgi:hypothetical protein